MTKKLYLILFFCFLCTQHAFTQENIYHIRGKVSGNEWDTVSSLIHAYLHIKEKPETGFLTDSSGCFQIDHLKKGKYHLTVSFVGFESHDTIIRIKNNSIDQLNIVLPLYYNQKEVSIKHARKGIKKGHPHLYACTENEKDTTFHTFYQKYKVWFTIYNRQLGKSKQKSIQIPYKVLLLYNQETFKHLDNSGKSWRQEIPPSVIGFENWIEQTLPGKSGQPLKHP